MEELMIKDFKAFLDKHNARKLFENGLKHYSFKSSVTTIDECVRDELRLAGKPYKFVNKFNWSKTDSVSSSFWFDLNNKWVAFCEKYKCDYNSIW